MSMESFSNQPTGTDVEIFEQKASFDEVLDVLEKTREKLGSIKRIPGFEKDVSDLELQIQNLEERLSTIKN